MVETGFTMPFNDEMFLIDKHNVLEILRKVRTVIVRQRMDDTGGFVVEVGDGEHRPRTEAPIVVRTAGSEWMNSVSPESPHVKSTAVVKYSSVPSLANFAVLQCNTDLNSPPSNWLSSSADSYGLQHAPTHSTGFSSFRMAHMFPECVGEVDVVSDAENIKKLLKIPYSKGVVSMMVHRIENALLIDEFDIHKYLLRTAESEWEWLRKFYYDHIMNSLNGKEKALPHKNKSRCALQQKSLVSKFLYHSLAVEVSAEAESAAQTEAPSPCEKASSSQIVEDKATDTERSKTEANIPLPVRKPDPPLPEPDLERELPDPACKSKFTRNVLWTFEDIQMLIGTNLPIFGGKTHPCVSLRLRDMSKPINVLTGIDYWLDNLMCNVPELVMCFHIDGFVQKYELIKTEDLPYLENSKFSPKVVRDVAQNILSFLKSNATKAGHTYWLFKGKDAEIVKLYDLTSLCTDITDDKGQNPFTVPVGMLLYRVARNMKHSNDRERRQLGTIRLLLKNCIDLLPKEKYPQIVTSAHYMLADLYVPADTDPASPNLKENIEDERTSQFDEDPEGDQDTGSGQGSDPPASSVYVHSLCVATSLPPAGCAPPPPLCSGVEERCFSALEHIVEGLHCIAFFDWSKAQSNTCEDNAENDKDEPNCPSMAKPFEAIPMPYAPLNSKPGKEHAGTPGPSFKKTKKPEKVTQLTSPRSLLCKYRTETLPTWQQPKPGDKVFWRAHLKTLLYEKSCLVYATMAEDKYSKGSYGSALQYYGMVLKCELQLEAMMSAPNWGLQSYILGRAGDLCFMIVQDWAHVDRHRKEYNRLGDIDKKILKQIKADRSKNNTKSSLLDLFPTRLATMEDMLLASRECYLKALSIDPVEQTSDNLQRRLGNIENEIGVLYMNRAASCYEEMSETVKSSKNTALQSLMKKSLKHMQQGIRAFEAVHDDANLALLHSNTGRLMRMWGHYQVPDFKKRNPNTGTMKFYCSEALSSYQTALTILGSRKKNPNVWDSVMWELSSCLVSMAFSQLEHPEPHPGRTAEEELRGVIELFLRALKYCDYDTPGSRQAVYQLRAALIHYHLGALYHRMYRFAPVEESKRKKFSHLARVNYEKACKLFALQECPTEYFTAMLGRVALAEMLSCVGSPSTQIKNLLVVLQTMTESINMLRYIVDNPNPEGCDENIKGEKEQKSDESQDALTDKLKEVKIATSPREKKNASRNNALEGYKMKLEDVDELLHHLEQTVQFILLQLVKMYHNAAEKGKKDTEGNESMFKSLYALTLRKEQKISIKELAARLLSILEQVDSKVFKSGTALKTQ